MPGTRLRAGGGVYRQFADIDQVFGVGGSGTARANEMAMHLDVGLTPGLRREMTLQATWYARDERECSGRAALSRGGYRTGRSRQGARTRRRSTRSTVARGVSSSCCGATRPPGCRAGRLCVWPPSLYRHRHRRAILCRCRSTAHVLSVWQLPPLASIDDRCEIPLRLQLSAAGCIGEQRASGGAPLPPLFGGGAAPLFYQLTDERNGQRLPAYRASRHPGRSHLHVVITPRHRVRRSRERAEPGATLRNVPYG